MCGKLAFMVLSSLDEVLTRVDELAATAAATGVRQLVGITGAPGAGKSTLADLVADRLGRQSCVVVPMDGFHLANRVLADLGRSERKGAIDTFDVEGYVGLLERLRRRDEAVVYAPSYLRGLEEPIAGSIAVARSVPFVLTEGNYLLADLPPWNRVPPLLDATFFVETPHDIRIERLTERHVFFGKDRAAAEAWAIGPDETNALLIEQTRERADFVVSLEG